MSKRYLIAIGRSLTSLQDEVLELLDIDPHYVPVGGICQVPDDVYIQVMFRPLVVSLEKPIQLDYQWSNSLGDIPPPIFGHPGNTE